MGEARPRRRVLVAGLGDTGILTAIHLARHHNVVGVSVKPGLVSGQEVGSRIARPDQWARDYWIPFDRFRGLDRVRTVQGTLTALDAPARTVRIRLADDTEITESYDALVISTGVRNGFWRRPTLQSADQVNAEVAATHERLAAAGSVAVIGGGAAAVSSAANIAGTWPTTEVSLFFPGDRALPQHHPRVWQQVRERLVSLGVDVHPGHRAALPAGFTADRITDDPVEWSTGQAPVHADAVVWAIGAVRPNTDWLPPEILDDRGFVRVTADLRVHGHDNVFAVGDVAATDPLRNSARNRADRLLARNVEAMFRGKRLREYRPRHRRWGSVLGVQDDGLEVFAPNGSRFRFPAWSIESVLQPWIVRRGIYGGVRDRRA
ncbi:FAD-dependent oxidoreductase [Gordonia insulae]|uniref:Demethylphylloquinone reductase NdbB n=1 Tax=Gordonia insulae TaxID=2420509 RepID=A0A3G8JIW7_9ACTN|nr:FAD-dependent oxidoreductase [Gordonia insulae]AZG44452.1 Demethylphylloquinone reductase NdbB [Gordonia insulae]